MTYHREAYYDNAKWILILLVVFGHLISPIRNENPLLSTLYTTIYLFHMAGFILISGYFAKNFRKRGHLTKLAKKVLLPYVIFQVMYSVFYYAINVIKGEPAGFDYNLAMPHFTLWFLISLFCWNVLLYAYGRFPSWTVFVAFAAGLAIGFIDINKFLSISRTFVFFPFFLLGYYLKPEFFQELRRLPLRLIGGTALLAMLVLFYFYTPPHYTAWLECAYSYQHIGVPGWEGALIRLAQYALMLSALFSFLTLVPARQLSITVRGTRTLYVYLLHGFVIQLIRQFLPHRWYEALSPHLLVFIIPALVLTYMLTSRKTRKVAKPLVELRT
ncbi:MAG TPA: acyltransferase family protein [Bacillales bacterium]|nr:acyltransferase family protein [Bacillales bacterium]